MHIDHVFGRDAFVAELTLLLGSQGLTDHELLATSRCRGWTVADVLTHVHLGLQEMLLGIVSPTTSRRPSTRPPTGQLPRPATTTRRPRSSRFASYAVLSSAYRRLTGGVRHLELTARILGRAVTRTVDEAHLDFQGHVITTGDFFATWAVELAVHHLDLDLGADHGATDHGRSDSPGGRSRNWPVVRSRRP